MTKPITFSMLAGISLLLTVLIAHAADNGVDVRVRNNLESPVNVFLKTGNGETSYGTIPIGGSRVQGSRPGDVWVFKSGSVNDSYSATDASDQSYEVGVRDTITRNFLNDTDQPLSVYEAGQELAAIRGEGTVTLDLLPGTYLQFRDPKGLEAEHVATTVGESYLTVGTDEDAEIVLAARERNEPMSARTLKLPDMPDATKEPSGSDEGLDFNAKVRSLSRVPMPVPYDETKIDNPENTKVPVKDGNYECTTQWYKAAPEYNEMIVLDPQTDIIFPGSLIRGDSLASGEYIQIVEDRNNITISTSLQSIDGGGSREVYPDLSSVRESMREIWQQGTDGATAARMTFLFEDVYSKEDLEIKLRGAGSTGLATLKGAFKFGVENIRSRQLLKFNQVFFSIDVNAVGAPVRFFSKPESVDFANFGNAAPMYVSSVKYGRAAYFALASESSKIEVQAALAFSWNDKGYKLDEDDDEDGKVEEEKKKEDETGDKKADADDQKDEDEVNSLSGKGKIEAEYNSTLKTTSIQGTIIGGAADKAAGAIRGVENMLDFIELVRTLRRTILGFPSPTHSAF